MEESDLSVLKEKTILFVDDEPITCKAIERMLGRYCKEVYLAENGEEGLEKTEKHSPDIVITDIEMPIMDGLELLQRIKEHHPQKPVVIMTAFADQAHKAEKADLVMIKPIDRNVMFPALVKLFETH